MGLNISSNRVRILTISLLVILALAATYSLVGSHEPLKRNHQSTESSRLFVIGDVTSVLEGRLTSKRYFDQDTTSIMFAGGAGTLNSIISTGEMLVVDGKAYVKSCNQASGYKTESSTKILTPFSYGLEKRSSKPSAIYHLETRDYKGYSIDSVYQMLSKEHGRMFAVGAVAEFREIHRSAIKLAPMYNESITAPKNREKYFHNLTPINDTVCVFFGVINNPGKPPSTGYDAGVEEKIFYINPAEKGGSALQSHTHVLITSNSSLNFRLQDSEDDLWKFVKTLSVVDVNHLLTQSTLRKATIMVYEIKTTAAIAKTSAAPSITGYVLINDYLTRCICSSSRSSAKWFLSNVNPVRCSNSD